MVQHNNDDEDISTSPQHQLEKLLDLIGTLRASTDLQRKLDLIAKGIQVCGWNRVHLYLYDSDREELKSAAYAGLSDEEVQYLEENRMSPEEIEILFSDKYDEFKIGRCYYIPHDTDKELVHELRSKGLDGTVKGTSDDDWHPEDLLYIPLKSKLDEKPLGLLSVDDPVNGKAPTEKSLRTVELFVDYVVSVIEEREFERYFQKTQNLLDRLFYVSPTMNIVTDENRKIISVNRAAVEKFGYSRSDFLGKDERALFVDNDEYEELLQQRNENNEYYGECYFVPKDGTEFPGYINTVAVFTAGKEVEGYILIISDFTERKALERQLIQAEKMAGIGVLASGVAHELNNPLYSISGLIEAALEEDDIDVIKKYLRDMLESTEEAAEIVKELHEYSRSSQTQGSSSVDIEEVVSSAVKMLDDLGKLEGVEVKKKIEGTPNIIASRREIEQLMVDLISNSAEAIEETGKITVNATSTDKEVKIQIEDTGKGIREEELDKVFEPFYTTKDPAETTGLGLYISYRIVIRYDGDISIDSEWNKGTTITITFPTE